MTSYKVFIIKTNKKLTFGLGRAACGAIDTFTSGLGNDTFVFANGGGHDTIADFTIGQDKVDLTDGRYPDPVQALVDAADSGANLLDFNRGNIITSSASTFIISSRQPILSCINLTSKTSWLGD